MNLNAAEYLNELDAASLTGVSSKTLKRFAEAGYFSVDTSADGAVRYHRQALCDVFGIGTPAVGQSKIIDLELAQSKSRPSALPPEAPSAEAVAQSGAAAEISPPLDATSAASPTNQEDTSQSSAASVEATDSAHTIMNPGSAAAPAESGTENPPLKTGTIELLERLIERLEDEIRGLKSERQWLRERVERLEEKAERDQLLLLAESQTIKRLVASMHRKSTVRQALEWFGLLPPTDEDGNEVERKALPGAQAPTGAAQEQEDKDPAAKPAE